MTNHNSTLKVEDIIKLQDREEAYHNLVALYIRGPEQVRENIRKSWDYGVEWVYPNPRRLSCSKNEKRSSRERILASLVYDAIEDFRGEGPRDKLVALSVIYHSCIEAGLNPQEEFESIASISSEKVANFFREFIQRNLEDKSKEAFMLTIKKNSDGETEIFPSWMK
jgi:hypothetical protein